MRVFDEAEDSGVLFLCAPAGYGKSVSARLWLEKTGRRFAWVGLDEYDNTPSVFYRLFCDAVLSCAPGGGAMEEAFRDAAFPTAPVEHTIRGLSEFVPDGVPRAIVLDDYHLITNAEIRRTLPFVLMRLPQPCIVLIASRNLCEAETAEFKGHACDTPCITAADLQFKPEEVRRFLDGKGIEATSAQLDELMRGTGGWAFGVNAVSQAGVVTERVLDDITLDSYLKSEIWSKWSARLQGFLLKISVTDEVDAALAEALTGEGDAEALLEEACRKSAFIVAAAPHVYRCHSLFLRFLRASAAAAGVDFAPLHRTMAEWCLEHRRYFEARYHAIYSEDAELMARAVQMSQAYTNPSFDEYVTFYEAFNRDKLPDAILDAYPFLLASPIICNYLRGHREETIRYLDRLYRLYPVIGASFPAFREPAISMSVLDPRLPLVDQLRRFRDLWGRIPWVDHVTTSALSFHFPLIHRSILDYHELTDAGSFELYAGTLGRMAKGFFPIADCALRAGLLAEQLRFPEASAILRPVLAELRAPDGICAEAPAEFCFGLFMLSALLEFEQGNADLSAAELRRAGEMIRARHAEYLDRNFRAVKAGYALERGEAAAASEWLSQFALELEGDGRPMLFKIPRHLTTARAFLVAGQPDRAENTAQAVRRLALEFRRPLDAAEAGALISVCRWQRGDKAGAAEVLAEVVRALAPSGFARPVTDEGRAILPVLRKLLREAKPQGDPAYRQSLGRLISGAQRVARYRRGLTGEPQSKPLKLTRQQERLLKMCREGYTRAEIADEMFLSVHTVKAHFQIIYRKLEVHSATEAILKAEQLGLLD
ncbi:MAG: LuxR C-terminal-related transcriptional regulator [Clostridiales Family XIII bacterium]|jgi:LuxR family maltose regulon positive regulatory protein|nr:LuxR C-terminal-related transcriptional regulator [Clostridiales Family XIII bacterium]